MTAARARAGGEGGTYRNKKSPELPRALSLELCVLPISGGQIYRRF